VKELSFAPDVIKIDVEGHEASVLRGLTETLSARPLLFLELHPQFLRDHGAALRVSSRH
jgi:FkbM family methyltransferase